MDYQKVERISLGIVKKVMLLIIGSGLLTNALYLYGMSFYQGFLSGFGFVHELFPIEWSQALIWTYYASQWLGVTGILLLTDFSEKQVVSAIFIILFAFYMLVRFWMFIDHQSKRSIEANKQENKKITKEKSDFFNKRPSFYKYVVKPIKWMLIKEQSIIAFIASYFLFLLVFFVFIFAALWTVFPYIGYLHGVSVAEIKVKAYKKSLCGSKNDRWLECITIKAPYIEASDNRITGRLIFNNKGMLAIYTDSGPVTVTLPKKYYNKHSKNPCFEIKDCTEYIKVK